VRPPRRPVPCPAVPCHLLPCINHAVAHPVLSASRMAACCCGARMKLPCCACAVGRRRTGVGAARSQARRVSSCRRRVLQGARARCSWAQQARCGVAPLQAQAVLIGACPGGACRSGGAAAGRLCRTLLPCSVPCSALLYRRCAWRGACAGHSRDEETRVRGACP
jgi:hypothetical protein